MKLLLHFSILLFVISNFSWSQENEVTKLRKSFDTNLAIIDKPLETLKSKYRKSLEDQISAFQSAGNIKGVLTAQEELKSFETKPTPADFPELKRLQGIYREQRSALEKKSMTLKLQLIRSYKKNAEQLAAVLTKQGKVAEAKLALEEAERIGNMENDPNVVLVPPSKKDLVMDHPCQDSSYRTVKLGPDRWGKANSAYEFNGEDSYLALRSEDRLSIGEDHQFTVTGWLRSDSRKGGHTRIFCTGSYNWSSGFCIGFGAGKSGLLFEMGDGKGTGTGMRSKTGIRGDGKWHHFAGVMDGGVAKLYINGVLEAEGKIDTEGRIEPTAKPTLGRSARGHRDSYFHGALDDVKCWNRPLSPGEIMYEARDRP